MSTDSPPERYHRRHRWPILAFIAVLLIGGGVIWFQILKPGPAAATGCNQPGPAPSSATPTTRTTLTSARTGSTTGTAKATGSKTTGKSSPAKSTAKTTAKSTTAKSTTAASSTAVTTTLGTFVAAGTLAATRPSDPSTVLLQVVNASGTRGLAKTLTTDLQQAGFASILSAGNDTLYPAADLNCQAEIRFGQAGLSQARTVLIVAPCAQLVMDSRINETVDLALGARYNFTPATAAVKAQLKAIHDGSLPPAVIEGQTAAPRPLASIPPLPSANCTSSPTTAG